MQSNEIPVFLEKTLGEEDVSKGTKLLAAIPGLKESWDRTSETAFSRSGVYFLSGPLVENEISYLSANPNSRKIFVWGSMTQKVSEQGSLLEFLGTEISLEALLLKVNLGRMEILQTELSQKLQNYTEKLQLMENIYEEALDLMIQVDPASKHILSANKMFYHTLGFEIEELLGKEFSEFIISQDEDTEIGDSVIGGSFLKKKNGELIPVETSFRLFTVGEKSAIWVTFRDISEKKKAQSDLKNQKAYYEFILDSIDSDISVLNENKIYEYSNPVMNAHPEFKDWIKDKTNLDLVKKMNLPEKIAIVRDDYLDRALFENQIIQFEEEIHQSGLDKKYYLRKYIPTIDTNSHKKRIISYGIDITERKEAEQRISYLAYYDSLTGLSNRTLFIDHTNQAIRNFNKSESFIAIYFFDIDNFKFINDTLGHAKGDMLLQMVSARLKRFQTEVDTIARFGGDEFGILKVNVSDQNDASQFALKVLEVLSSPFRLAERELFATISMGIALYPNDGDTSTQLLKNADMAMYKAKELGRNNFKFYTEELNLRTEKRMYIESSLRRALINKELKLFFQPQIDPRTEKVTGAEALIRWQHPDKGWIPPSDFIPIAEDSGLIEKIGDWVLEEACRLKETWKSSYTDFFLVSVNVSGKQLARSNWAQKVQSTIEKFKIEPGEIEIELTESSIMENPERSIEAFRYLATLGMKVSIDDFGTGYSSLSYLKKIDADYLKIDRSFVMELENNLNDRSICRAIINMAVSLDMEVIAEGVENSQQRDILKEMGCHYIQGFFYSKPLPEDQFLAFLLKQNS